MQDRTASGSGAGKLRRQSGQSGPRREGRRSHDPGTVAVGRPALERNGSWLVGADQSDSQAKTPRLAPRRACSDRSVFVVGWDGHRIHDLATPGIREFAPRKGAARIVARFRFSGGGLRLSAAAATVTALGAVPVPPNRNAGHVTRAARRMAADSGRSSPGYRAIGRAIDFHLSARWRGRARTERRRAADTRRRPTADRRDPQQWPAPTRNRRPGGGQVGQAIA